MKKIYFVIVAIALLAVSCSRKAEFQHETFATLDAVKFTVREDVGEFVIPVSLYNPTGAEVQLIVLTKDSTAVKDVDYEIVSPASGVLTFSGDETTKDIVIKLNHNTAFQKSKLFYISIESADDNFQIGNLSTATCKIKDAEHPLDKFIGEWKGTAASVYDGATYPVTVTISEDESDETYTKLLVEGIDPVTPSLSSQSPLKAVVNADKTQLVIRSGQQIGYYDGYDSYFRFCAFEISGEYMNQLESLTLTYNTDGTITVDDTFGCLFIYSDGNEYVFDAFAPGLVLTRK